jgi:C4-dicarboxylate-specific signal transduction histidine kinase
LRRLGQPAPERKSEHDRSESELPELQVYRLQLEMQNQALRDLQSELEGALQRYTDLYDYLPIGYVTLTRTGQIVQANLTAARWLRRDRGRLIGVHMNWFLDAFDAGRFAAHLEHCAHSKDEQTCEVTLRLENDLTLTVQISSHAAPKTGDDSPGYTHTAITNIAQLKQARAMMDDIDREDSALATMARAEQPEPFAGVSHLLQSLLAQHRDDLAADAVSLAERAEGAAVRLEMMLRHMMDYCGLSQSDGGAHDPVNLEELVQQMVLEHRGVIQSRGAHVEVARPLPCVRGSRMILAQVLSNLLINALRLPPGDEPVRISISAEQQDGVVRLKLADDGLCLPGDGQSFRVFERLHGSRHFLTDGAGFALIQRAIKGMNGRVHVEAGVRQGSTFTIELERM